MGFHYLFSHFIKSTRGRPCIEFVQGGSHHHNNLTIAVASNVWDGLDSRGGQSFELAQKYSEGQKIRLPEGKYLPTCVKKVKTRIVCTKTHENLETLNPQKT
jgi:hypothetical protein